MTESTTSGSVRRVSGEGELLALVDEEASVLVEFYSRSCPKCDAMEPVLGLVAREFDGIVAMVDPGTGLDLLRSYDVRSTPGFVRFVDGEAAGTLADGVVPAERLLAFARGDLDE